MSTHCRLVAAVSLSQGDESTADVTAVVGLHEPADREELVASGGHRQTSLTFEDDGCVRT